MRVGPSRRLNAKELMFLNCGVGETVESPLVCEEIKHKENQPSIFIESTEAKAPIVWPPDSKSRLTGKDHDAGKD